MENLFITTIGAEGLVTAIKTKHGSEPSKFVIEDVDEALDKLITDWRSETPPSTILTVRNFALADRVKG